MRRASRFLAGLLFAASPLSAAEAPQYAADGKIIPPADYREWIFLSAGLDMNYSELPPGAQAAGIFGNVFVNPSAYRAFMATGAWPDKTTFVLENRRGSGQGSITKNGKFQTDLWIMELHIKDEARGGWAFYAVRNGAPASKIPQTATCYSCHQDHGAVDTTFVQFYPTLVPVARAKGTFHEHELATKASLPTGPRPGAEAALRDAIAAIARGEPSYSHMAADAATLIRGMAGKMAPALEKFGAIAAVKYLGAVEPAQPFMFAGEAQKLDEFEVGHAGGTSVWRIFVQPDGTIGRIVPFSTYEK